MSTRRDRQERRLQDAMAAHEAEWRADHGPLGEMEGEEFFGDLPADGEYDGGQRDAVRDVRAALVRSRPRHVRAQDTRGGLDGRGYLRLHIPHRSDPDVAVDLVYGDGYLSLTWPDGEEHDRWEWSPLLALTVEALLSGRNEQTFHARLGRIFAVDTEVWDEHGRRHRRRLWRRRQALLALVSVAPSSRVRRSISFDRSPAIEEA